MIGSGPAIEQFVDRIAAAAEGPMQRDLAVVLERYRRDVPGADAITSADLGFGDAGEARAEEVPIEKTQIEAALLNANGSVSRAAEALGLSRQALYRRMEKLGVVLERRPR